jgi:hypothetical protein
VNQTCQNELALEAKNKDIQKAAILRKIRMCKTDAASQNFGS